MPFVYRLQKHHFPGPGSLTWQSFTDIFTVSANGKVLTDEGNAVSVNEPTKAIYERE